MALKPQIQEILANARGEEGIFADTFAFNPTNSAEEPLGNLYLLGELRNASERASFIINLIATVIRREYYEDPKRGLQESFQQALKKANATLHELSRQGYEEWLGNLRFAVVSFSDPNLRLAVMGGAELFIVREQQLMELTRDPTTPGGGLFLSTIRGKARPGDILLLANRLLKELDKKRDLTLAKLPEYLSKQPQPTAVLLLTFQEGRSMPVKEVAKPRATRISAPVLKQGLAVFRRLPSPALLLGLVPKRIPRQNLFAHSSIRDLIRRMPKLRPPRISLASIPHLAKKIPQKRAWHFPRIPAKLQRKFPQISFRVLRQRKRVLPVAALVLFAVFLLGLFGLFENKAGKNVREVSRLVTQAKENIAEAETVLIYGDKPRAAKLLEHARAQAEEALVLLPGQKEAVVIRNETLVKLHDIAGVIPVADGTILVDFSGLPVVFHPETILGVSREGKGPVLFLTDPASPGFYRYDTDTQQGKFVFGELSGTGFSAAAALSPEQNILGFLNGEALLLYHADEDRFIDGRPLRDKKDEGVAMLAAYKGNFYVLDTSSGVIVKVPVTKQRLGEPTRWTKKGAAEILRGGTGLAVDGLVWILAGDGKVHQFANGAYRKEFPLAALDENFHPTRMAVTEGQDSIRLLGPEQERLVFLKKETGEIARQYVGSVWRNAEDFWLENDRTAFILKSTELIRIDLAPDE